LHDLAFEEAVERLEKIIDQIETGETGLEESLARYEQGMELVSHCRRILDRADQRIKELTKRADGAFVEAEAQTGEGAEEGADTDENTDEAQGPGPSNTEDADPDKTSGEGGRVF